MTYEEQRAIDSAKYLHDFCDKQYTCGRCIFWDMDKCALKGHNGHIPEEWVIEDSEEE